VTYVTLKNWEKTLDNRNQGVIGTKDFVPPAFWAGAGLIVPNHITRVTIECDRQVPLSISLINRYKVMRPFVIHHVMIYGILRILRLPLKATRA